MTGQNIWMIKFEDDRLAFEQETDELGDIPEAEASYFSIHGYWPGQMHWDDEALQ